MNTMSFFGGGMTPGNISRKVCSQMLSVCSGVERFLTRQMLIHSSVVSLAQDARDDCLLVRVRMVLWTCPRQLARPLGKMPSGIEPVVDDGPPWIVERVLGVARLAGSRTAEAMVEHSLCVLKESCASEDVFEDVKGKFIFFVTDNAADEIKVGVLLQQHFPCHGQHPQSALGD
jgi:hypothetical protein